MVEGYESNPVKQVKAILEITESLHRDIKLGEIISIKIKEKVPEPIDWSALKSLYFFRDSDVFKNNQSSLFRLTEEEFEAIQAMIDAQ